MADSEKSLFELMGELSTYPEGSPQHKYCYEQFEKRKKLLEALWTPYFEEIKRKTEWIQKILKENWYENVDLSLKSLIIGWIKFFLNLDYQIRVDDDIRFDDYFLWLFDSLKININNKELLRDILLELESWWEELPESPLEFLINYDYNNNIAVYSRGEGNKLKSINKKIVDSKNGLDTILEWFRKSDYRKTLLKVWDPTPEYTFVQQVLDDIFIILGWGELEYKEKSFLRWIWIEINNKESLEYLQENLKSYIINFFTQKGIPINEGYFEKKERDFLESEMNKKHKESITGNFLLSRHCAYDDSSDKVRTNGEDVVIYNVWDEYVPSGSHWNSIELLEKVNSSSYDELVEMYIEQDGEEWKRFLKNLENIGRTRQSIIKYIKQYLLEEYVDFIWMYKDWDRFKVVKGTYNDKEIYDSEEISCWYVNIKSKNTWKIYRVLSI